MVFVSNKGSVKDQQMLELMHLLLILNRSRYLLSVMKRKPQNLRALMISPFQKYFSITYGVSLLLLLCLKMGGTEHFCLF